MWTPTELNEGAPIYLSIADALGRDIREGRVQPGERLPTHRDLARRIGVNVMTVSRAYAEASRRGLVEGEVGRGTFVRAQDRRSAAILPMESDPNPLIDLHFNVPAGDPKIVEASDLFRTFAKDPERAHLASGYSATGLPHQREAGANWMRRFGIDATPDRTLVCGGAQHAMSIVFAALGAPGDVLLTDDLTYPGAKALASVLHLRLRPLPTDEEGLLPDAFEDECKKGQAKALYCMPTVHNPLATVLSPLRREAIALIARRYGLVVIEDDTYAYLCRERIRPVYSYAPERTVYITGTSKPMASGLRIGYLQAPETDAETGISIERLAANSAAISYAASPLTAEIATHWIETGKADAMVQWKRDEARARRALFNSILGELETHSYAGSSHVWVQLPEPWRGADFAAEARLRGVAITPAESFAVGRAAAPHAVRLCLGTPATRKEVERALRVLAELLHERPGRCTQVI